ncbi:hypothetical protein BK819_15360 [Microbacterium sp. LCT-H2]|nr:hypothetical protein BK819_15360 [Microbacterium sp. LCT-H2]
MLVRQSGILVDQPGRHRQVSGDELGVLLAERLQLVARGRVQVACGDLVREARLIEPRTLVRRVGRTFPAGAATLREGPRTVAPPLTLEPALATRSGVTVVTTLTARAGVPVVAAFATRSAVAVVATLTTRRTTVTVVATSRL